MARKGYFTENDLKLIDILSKNPDIGPSELSQRMGWKERGTAGVAVSRLKKKIKKLEESHKILEKYGISKESIEKW